MSCSRTAFFRIGSAALVSTALARTSALADVEHTVDPDAAPGPSAAVALRALVDGNRRFARGDALHPRQDIASRKRVAPRQKPFAVVLDCADSRLPAEIIFDQGIGDLFTCRVAGNIADPATVGSIEYAVDHFHPSLIVVLGHENCGAVAATIDAGASRTTPTGSIGVLIDAIRPALNALDANDRTKIGPCVRANARYVAAALGGSPIVKAAKTKSHLRVVSAVYNLTSGMVELI